MGRTCEQQEARNDLVSPCLQGTLSCCPGTATWVVCNRNTNSPSSATPIRSPKTRPSAGASRSAHAAGAAPVTAARHRVRRMLAVLRVRRKKSRSRGERKVRSHWLISPKRKMARARARAVVRRSSRRWPKVAFRRCRRFRASSNRGKDGDVRICKGMTGFVRMKWGVLLFS